MFVSAVRLDGAGASIVLDAAVLPLTAELLGNGELDDLLAALKTLEPGHSLAVSEAKLVLWKKLLPALAERCRT